MGISVGAASDLVLRQGFIAHQATIHRLLHVAVAAIILPLRLCLPSQTPTLAAGSSTRKQYLEQVLEMLFNHSEQRMKRKRKGGRRGGTSGREEKEEEMEERNRKRWWGNKREEEKKENEKWKREEEDGEEGKRELDAYLLSKKWWMIVHFNWWGEIMLCYCNLEVSRQTFSCFSG